MVLWYIIFLIKKIAWAGIEKYHLNQFENDIENLFYLTNWPLNELKNENFIKNERIKFN
jgi:hypothetical protein